MQNNPDFEKIHEPEESWTVWMCRLGVKHFPYNGHVVERERFGREHQIFLGILNLKMAQSYGGVGTVEFL